MVNNRFNIFSTSPIFSSVHVSHQWRVYIKQCLSVNNKGEYKDKDNGVWDLGVIIWKFWSQNCRFNILDFGLRVWDLGFQIQELIFGIWDSGLEIQNLSLIIWDFLSK